MTTEELEAIKGRLLAACKCDEWGKHGVKLTFSPEEVGRPATIWYGDGDQCAQVHGNLGLGIDGDAIAEFLANSIEDVKKLLQEIEACRP